MSDAKTVTVKRTEYAALLLIAEAARDYYAHDLDIRRLLVMLDRVRQKEPTDEPEADVLDS